MEAALSLFAAGGFEGTTTREIADRACVTEAVIFRYFPTKRELFREVVAEYGPTVHFPICFESHRSRPFAEALATVIGGYLDHAWTNRRVIRLFLHATFHDEDIRNELSALFEHRRRRLDEMVRERVETGELRPDAKEHGAEAITLATTGFLVRSLRQEPPDWSEARDRFLRALAGTMAYGLLA